MGLPFSSLPHILAVDDVVPAELVQALVDKANDAVQLVEQEHRIGGPDAGLHDVITIPVAVAQVVIPSGTIAQGSHGLTTHFSVGLVGSPEWSVTVAEDYDDPTVTTTSYLITLRVPETVVLIGAAASARTEWGQRRLNVPSVTVAPHYATIPAWPTGVAGEEAVSILVALYGYRRD